MVLFNSLSLFFNRFTRARSAVYKKRIMTDLSIGKGPMNRAAKLAQMRIDESLEKSPEEMALSAWRSPFPHFAYSTWEMLKLTFWGSKCREEWISFQQLGVRSGKKAWCPGTTFHSGLVCAFAMWMWMLMLCSADHGVWHRNPAPKGLHLC